MLQAEWLVARDHKHKTMPGQLCSCPQPCVPSRMLCKPEEVYKWSHDNAKSKEVTAVVCPALLCAFSNCSLAFFPLIFLFFCATWVVPLLWQIPQQIVLQQHKKKMQPTNPNAHTYVNGTDVQTHGYAVTQNTFLQ